MLLFKQKLKLYASKINITDGKLRSLKDDFCLFERTSDQILNKTKCVQGKSNTSSFLVSIIKDFKQIKLNFSN